MKYRIKIITEANGDEEYYPQKRIFGIWVLITDFYTVNGVSFFNYSYVGSMEQAVEVIQNRLSKKKVSKRIVNFYPMVD